MPGRVFLPLDPRLHLLVPFLTPPYGAELRSSLPRFCSSPWRPNSWERSDWILQSRMDQPERPSAALRCLHSYCPVQLRWRAEQHQTDGDQKRLSRVAPGSRAATPASQTNIAPRRVDATANCLSCSFCGERNIIFKKPLKLLLRSPRPYMITCLTAA